MRPTTTVHIRNLQALRSVRWSPQGVSCLVGPNGSGKSTLVLSLKLLRAAWERGLPWAVSSVLGGSWGLRNREAPPAEPIEIGIDTNGTQWRVELVPSGGTVANDCRETLTSGGRTVFESDGLGNVVVDGRAIAREPNRTGLRLLHDMRHSDPAIAQLAETLQGLGVFRPPSIAALRQGGSNAADDLQLHTDGSNAFAVLHSWHSQRESRERYRFVLDWLSAAFPDEVQDLDFQVMGNTVSVRTFRPGDDEPMLISRQSDGCIAMLVQLCALATLREGGLVAIEEPENSLHPWAIRRLTEAARDIALRRGGSVVFTSHSPVLLNQFAGEPEQVFFMARDVGDRTLPLRLSDERDRGWLGSFVLGELYEHGNFGGTGGAAT